ncbi:MAG: insulinase family protein [Oscillospiraceae bacterium]|nr:insulinase family protein [Oscillospiraceae bacterium]
MTQTIELLPGVTLRCFPDDRFKQGTLSFQIIRPMAAGEVALNALIPTVLLRGTVRHPDLRSITLRLDELYGAAVGATVRRVGDYQTTGLTCGFIEDKYALPGDRVLEPMLDFLRELLLEPVLHEGGFDPGFVESEKKNLISTIESDLNDKRVYAMNKMLRAMCRADSYGIPRLGTVEDVAKIDPVTAWEHYQRILRTSRVDIFYVGTAPAETVARLLMPIFDGIHRDYQPLGPQTPFHDAGGEDLVETMDVAQGKLCLGYVTPITNRDPRFAAMQVANAIFGAGMTSKLFVNVREKLSLCYSIGSGYYGSKGLVTVSAGIDFAREEQTRAEIARQLDAVRSGEITEEELRSAKEALLSSLRSTHDSPGAIEGYYATAALSGLAMTPAQYMDAIRAVTAEQVAAAARELRLHTTYFLKGETA